MSASQSLSNSLSFSNSRSESLEFPNVQVTTNIIFETPITEEDLGAIQDAYQETVGDNFVVVDTYVEETIVESETKFKVVVVVEAQDGYYQELETQLLTQSESKTDMVTPEDVGNIVAEAIGDAIRAVAGRGERRLAHLEHGPQRRGPASAMRRRPRGRRRGRRRHVRAVVNLKC